MGIVDCDDDSVHVLNLNNTLDLQLVNQLITFGTLYGNIHSYLCTCICTFGICANLIHIIVLSRIEMRHNAVSVFLMLMAACDIIIMSSYLVYMLGFVRSMHMIDDVAGGYSYGWTLFLLMHVIVSVTLHTITLYLSVSTACIRCIVIDRHKSRWMMSRVAILIFVITTLVIGLLSIPTLLFHQIDPLHNSNHEYTTTMIMTNDNYQQLPIHHHQQQQLYTLKLSTDAFANSCTIYKINLYLTGLLFKVIPCLLLFVFTITLTLKLRSANLRLSNYLTQKSSSAQKPDQSTLTAHHRPIIKLTSDRSSEQQPTSTTVIINDNQKRRRRQRRTDRTTYALVAMLTVFLLTELPQGMLTIFNAISTTQLQQFISLSVGDFLDLLSLLNCNSGFILYVIMCSNYRHTLSMMIKSWIPFTGRFNDTNDFVSMSCNYDTVPMRRKSTKFDNTLAV